MISTHQTVNKINSNVERTSEFVCFCEELRLRTGQDPTIRASPFISSSNPRAMHTPEALVKRLGKQEEVLSLGEGLPIGFSNRSRWLRTVKEINMLLGHTVYIRSVDRRTVAIAKVL